MIIITGDEPLTAAHVAKNLHIITKPVQIIETLDDISYSDDTVYTGKVFDLLSDDQFLKVIQHCNIFARMSPQQKSKIIIGLKSLKYTTFMVGDGTNDVGALKQSDVGMGLLENSLKDETFEDKPKLGAASIASPFVSKRPTVSSVIDIIRYGRATLSTTIDLFKQISMSCISSAFSKSILYMENVRYGDRQSTIFGMILSVVNMSNSMAKPLRELSPTRPFKNQFNFYLVCSVLLQSLVHFILLLFVHQLVIDNGFIFDDFNFRARFNPNLMNTAMFIVSSEIDIMNVFVNYRGEPFMQSVKNNYGLLTGVGLGLTALFIICLDLHPLVNKLFQLVEFPSKIFRWKLILYLILDSIFTLLAEKVSLWIFGRKSQIEADKLVSSEVKKEIEDYLSRDDDILPEDLHDFSVIEMLKQNAQNQLIEKAQKQKEQQDQMRKMREQVSNKK